MAEPSTRTVERALQLLGSVCDAGSLSLADAARGTELSASTALRLLRTLESTGFVRKDEDGAYRPGLRIVQLGAQALSHESIISLAEPGLARLVEATGESAYLNVKANHGAGADQGLYIAMREGTHSVRHSSWVGRTVPLKGSASGAVLTGNTPVCGYAVVDRGVEADVTAIAAPITVTMHAPDGSISGRRVIAALSVVAPSYRMTPEKVSAIGCLVTAEADRILTAYQQENQP
ncbi:IclR family transcriptional regulator [Paeniglutamicibacter cryotolerans]|uniref:DNA-binding IclR family transcriptional regulator n=1 Tax=Paeniglutamicibacter cryotolerans TaxID=670079 RepID=A0A839QS36_9MICC|nr:IclR family transcriptional regulator [Paeniglutamicibacter cryotolerans]MBB2996072.1 DNA-binding IclR family transcriptional regulator [Paeniglutamicibacter cryotolerans]